MAIRNLVPDLWKRREPSFLDRPESAFSQLHQEMNRLFEDFFHGFDLVSREGSIYNFSPRVNVKESDTKIHVSAELPGMDIDDIDISLSKDILSIRGEKKEEKESKEGNYYHMERSYGRFERHIALPGEVDADKIEANFKNGVLTVDLPKKGDTAKPAKKIAIKSDK